MNTIMHKPEPGLVILGGGVAGLMAAIDTGAPIYEADPDCGGAAASDCQDDFTFDRGIHVLQTTNAAIITMLEDLGVKFGIIDRSAHIYAFGKFTAYPFQINSTNLRVDRRLHCVTSFLRRSRNKEPTNYAEWIYRSIGRGFGDTFLIPYSEKFWGVHPREMSFEWTGNRVPKADAWQVLRGAVVSRNTRVGTNATFRYPSGAGGYGTVAQRMRERIAGQLHCSHRATLIDTQNRTVVFNGNRLVGYKVLLSTIPLPVLAGIVDEIPDTVQEAIDMLRTNSIMVVNLGIDRAAITDKHWIHFPERDISFFRISFPHNFSDQLAPAGMSSISAEVSYQPGESPDRAVLVERVIADLRRVGILHATDRIMTKHTRDIPFGYCIFNDDRRRALPIIRQWLTSVGIVPGGRYGQWTYFWSDEAILSGRKAAKLALRLMQHSDAAEERMSLPSEDMD